MLYIIDICNIAQYYISGELKGKLTHGIFSFIRLYERLKEKKRGHFKVLIDKPASAYIAGNGDAGQLVADFAIKLAMKKAKRVGVAAVGAGNITAFLRPGYWAEYAARHGMVSLCFNYGGGALVAPPGGREPVISTNPIGIGIPHKPFPFIIDMAISERAYTNIDFAKKLGIKIPAGWAIDQRGRTTRDPWKVAAVLPFGGYKGFALGLALELMTGPLMRTAVGRDERGKPRGFLFIVINPSTFTTRARFTREVAETLRFVKAAKRLPGITEIVIPGERSFRIEQQNLRRGWFDIDRRIIETIKSL